MKYQVYLVMCEGKKCNRSYGILEGYDINKAHKLADKWAKEDVGFGRVNQYEVREIA